MRDRDLATVLMVRAFEEQEGAATLLPPADREAAAREAARNVAGHGEERLLVERARLLYDRIASRHPVVETVTALTQGFASVELVAIFLGLAAGFGLSALDGTRRIQVISPPLALLLLYNLVVYVLLLIRALVRRERSALVSATFARVPASFAQRVIARSRAFDTTLAGALERFVRSWFAAALPVNYARAMRALHLAAAAVGLGLIAGLYLRGLVLDYRAGWESTFLSGEQAHRILSVLYGPASWIASLPLPGPVHLEAIRWRPGGGGEPAARWIHLMALTTLLFVVAPRLVLALVSATRVWHARARMPVPQDLHGYFRAAFSSVESIVPRAKALVIPFAHDLGAGALARLIAWISANAAGKVDVEAAEPLPYGEEERYLETLAARGAESADLLVLPFGLATTPEVENHGTVIQGVRDWIAARKPDARVLVVIDESGYAERMAAAPERIAERREAWRAFVEARGLKPQFVRLQG